MIDQALNWLGIYRSIDHAYERGMYKRNQKTAFIPTWCIPKSMSALNAVLDIIPDVKINVRAIAHGGIYVFDNDLYIDQVLEQFSESEITFALAHELGHVDLGHTREMVSFMKSRVPSWVTNGGLSSMLHKTANERSAMSYKHEYQADAYATSVMIELGYNIGQITSAFLAFGDSESTRTHPGTNDRAVAIIKHYISETKC